MQDFEDKLFDDVSFSDLLRDIYNNSKSKEKKIDALIEDLSNMVNNLSDATIVVPLIKDYLEIGVRNDEHLIKLAAVCQRLSSNLAKSSSGEELLSEEEKQQLLNIANEQVKKIAEKVQEPLELKNK